MYTDDKFKFKAESKSQYKKIIFFEFIKNIL